MTKKLFLKLVMVVVSCSVFLAGCGKFGVGGENGKNLSSMEKIQKELLEMKSYSCNADVEQISNKGSNKYETNQFYKTTGQYRIEMLGPESVKGIVTVFDGNTVTQFNPRTEGKISLNVPETKDRVELFLGSFVKNYLHSEDVTVETSKMENSNCTVLEAKIEGNHPYMATEKLWIDNETIKPLKLVIYDPDGVERIIVTYKKIDYNVQLEDSAFTISKK